VIGLDQRSTVYSENAATGLYDTVAKADLKCRLAHVNTRPAASGNERAELAAIRNMLFDPSYVMTENVQVLVDGVRWQPVPGTFGALRGPSGRVVYRRCDVVRQS
jgi:hypothetical protein